jgi:formylglycine-generating enzyme required for sulfatase activity
MATRRIVTAALVAAAIILSCAKLPGDLVRDNPLDQNGTNMRHPVVVAMKDTSVYINDTITISAVGSDSNGTIVKYAWAKNGTVYADTTTTGAIKVVWPDSGRKAVRVKAVDDAAIVSQPDSCIVIVKLGAPVVNAMNDTTVAINDSFSVRATGTDTNGTIKKYLWALDGVNFIDSTDSGRTKTAFASTGVKTVRVKVRDDDNLQSAVDSVKVTVRDYIPINLSPANNASITTLLPTLTWKPGWGDTNFTVLLDTLPAPIAVAAAGTKDSSFTVTTPLKYNKIYYWQIIGHYATGQAAGPVWRFTTPTAPPPPAAPVLIVPSDGLTGISLTPTLSWSDTSMVTSYHLQVSADSVFASFVVNDSTLTSTSMTIASSLTNSTKYYWRVNATNVNGTSGWSPVWSFTTETAMPGGMVLIAASGQSFSMGQTGIADTVHTVNFTYNYYMDVTEVTQGDYVALMGVNPSDFTGTGDTIWPVEQVTWFDAVLYCNARSKRDGYDTVYSYTTITGTPGDGCTDLGGLVVHFANNGYRLPTGAEWEYACRAGTTTKCFWGDDSSAGGAYAWCQLNAANTTHAVATRLPNTWGLYDMHGNVEEWCNDWYDWSGTISNCYTAGSQTDPTGPATGNHRMLRGGWFNGVFYELRSAHLAEEYPYRGLNPYGFRCVRGPIPPPPPAWSALGSGMNDNVGALAVDSSGSLFAGGSFTTAGGAAANYIARWDGMTWSTLGSGMDVPYVGSFAFDGSGNIIAGGNFTTAGGVTVNHVARWDGMTWSSLGSGTNGGISCLAFDSSGNLYAGGSFTTAGGTAANNIAKWDGMTWSPLGSGTNDAVLSLVFDDSGNLYAGGYFTTAGGISVNRIAKWDGASWSPLGSGMNGHVLKVVIDSSGNLYAGGYFTTAGGISANHIAKWNGSAWSALGSGMNGSYVDALAFNGSGNLYAGGLFTTAGGLTVNYVAKWDGGAWSALGSGTNQQVSALVFDKTGDLYAGGLFTAAGGASANYIAKWK